MIGIYKITNNLNGHCYIGQSIDIKTRWNHHRNYPVHNSNYPLYKAFAKYGIENFTFELVEPVPKDQLSEREKFYINFYQTKEVGLNERNG